MLLLILAIDVIAPLLQLNNLCVGFGHLPCYGPLLELVVPWCVLSALHISLHVSTERLALLHSLSGSRECFARLPAIKHNVNSVDLKLFVYIL